MNEIKIENIDISKIKPYENNPRHNDEAVDAVANSIREFGFKVPLVIDKDNIIVTGHTRYKASIKLGIKEVPCIRASDLSEEQVKAFRIADNKVSELATWDMEKLSLELDDINLDMSAFGVEIEELPENDIEIDNDENDWYGDERERTYDAYNLGLIENEDLKNDFWQMPYIHKTDYIPSDLIGFNYAKTSKQKDVGIHFYIDDYQFERLWNKPQDYISLFWDYDCILTPDFSLYMDMPMPMKIWNIYRSRFIGAYYQSLGIEVIPTISWAEKETFEFCFKGIEKGGVVSISTIGVKRDKEALQIWKDGVTEMINQLEPKTILIYGGKLDYDFGNIETVYYNNHVTENWKKGND